MVRKEIKGSRRGLTFSFVGKEQFEPGRKYRYIVSLQENLIIIVPSEDKGNLISRKRCGTKIKSLIDIRSQEVREMVSRADTLKIEIRENEIQIRLYNNCAQSKINSIEEEKGRIGILSIGRELLLVSGGEGVSWREPDACRKTGFSQKKQSDKARDSLSDVIQVISLFSGAGMLDYPFSADHHFRIVYAAEYEHDAVETYRKNIGEHIQQVDIRSLTGATLLNADVIIGGPPCQPFSNANRHDNARHDKHKEGDMFLHFIRLVRECFVKVFAIENVPGLLSDRDGYYPKLLGEYLPEYEFASRIVTDCDLGGYTTRKRAILIGSRIGTPFIPGFKILPFWTAEDALKKVDRTWPNADDITKSSDLVRKKISMIPEGGNWRDLPKEMWTKSVHSNMYRRLDRKKPSIAIANWRKYLLSPPKWDDSGDWDRILSVSEAAALQGFEKDFVFCGSMNAKQQQVANGVTYAIGRFIKDLVKKLFLSPSFA